MARELGQAAHGSSQSMALGPRSWEYIYVGQERELNGHMARELGQVAHGSCESKALGPGSWEYVRGLRESILNICPIWVGWFGPRRGRRVIKCGYM